MTVPNQHRTPSPRAGVAGTGTIRIDGQFWICNFAAVQFVFVPPCPACFCVNRLVLQTKTTVSESVTGKIWLYSNSQLAFAGRQYVYRTKSRPPSRSRSFKICHAFDVICLAYRGSEKCKFSGKYLEFKQSQPFSNSMNRAKIGTIQCRTGEPPQPLLQIQHALGVKPGDQQHAA